MTSKPFAFSVLALLALLLAPAAVAAPPRVDVCYETQPDCQTGALACVIVGAAKYYCAPDVCYDAPEWCDPGMAIASPDVVAAPDAAAVLDAPVCGPLVGVRCADGSHFCWVYVNVAVHECVEL